MSILNNSIVPAGAADTGYTIDQSLRFNDDDSAYLSWTPSSAGNRKTWTFSCWVKRGDMNVGAGNINHTLFNTISGDGIQIRAGDSVPYMQINACGSELVTSQLFRDFANFYHIVLAVDSTNSTSNDRIQLSINGIRVTDFSSSSYPTLNAEGYTNNNIEHIIGRQKDLSRYVDGYLAEVNFIDGQALTPDNFGETDATYGHWKPIEYTGTYGTNGFYLNFAGGGIMSATGGTITTDGDYKVHSFTTDGTFTPSVDGYVEYLVIGGGGSGGNAYRLPENRGGGGGGAGGYRTGYLGVTGSTAYSITVGDGGAARPNITEPPYTNPGLAGEDSVFSTITAAGGGGGGSGQGGTYLMDGGSGGGGAHHDASGGAATAGQGNAGGGGTEGGGNFGAGGGGGAGAAGATSSGSGVSGAGGNGLASSITGVSVTRAGGGGGGGVGGTDGAAGSGGATAGDSSAAATANTGSGSGGTGGASGGVGAGGSGIVIIRYKFQ